VRFIGLDVHLDFCVIAICDRGRVRSGGRVPTSPQGLAILANSLGPDDHVALEATGNALAIARWSSPGRFYRCQEGEMDLRSSRRVA
jgi:transposase